ncbi:damage-inducible protein DinB [Olivibacter ginsenosidimutans]|uniref:Damage-inducible protein DinB n=1 Tax=Olivibacter ginsenosidimutans TaxID=1176537 RepID=A0ABP9BSG8_9SPHI
MEQAISMTTIEQPSLNSFVKNFVDYDLWTNLSLIKWLGSKPKELLEKEVASSFSSICLTLHHMWRTQGYWFAIINKKQDFQEEHYPMGLNNILAGLIEQSARIADFVKAMSEADLHEELPVESPWFTCTYAASEYIVQMVTHNTYHRGQLVTISHHLGFKDAPNTDYNFYNVMGR